MKRIQEIDGLRGLAALAIVICHLWPWEFAFGRVSVDLFFVLSGFLITQICLENHHKPGFLFNFYARRGLRIWPIYYLCILVVSMFPMADRTAIPHYLLYIQQIPRYWGGSTPYWLEMQHGWTLAIEEQFYMLWPALVMIAGRGRLKALVAGYLVAALVAKAAGIPQWTLLTSGHGLALGGLLAVLVTDPDLTRRPKVVARYATAAAATAAIFVVLRLALKETPFHAYWPVFVPLVTSLGFFALVGFISLNIGHRRLAVLRARPLIFLGTISYGLYLYHVPIHYGMHALIPYSSPYSMFTGWITFGLSMMLATASWYLIERPILALKDRFRYRGPAERKSSQFEPSRTPSPIAFPG